MTKEEIMQGTGLSEADLKALFLFEKLVQKSKPAPNIMEEDKKNLVSFLEKSIGNMDLNKQLLELGKLDEQDTGIGFLVIHTLRNLTFKTRHWHSASAEKSSQTTLPQVGIRSDLATLARDLEVFEDSGLIKQSPLLTQLEGDAHKALKEGFAKGVDISSQVIFFEIKATKGEHMFLHKPYQKDDFVLSEFLYNDEYKIRLDKLIENDAIKSLFKKNLGDDWLPQLEKKFAIIQRTIHDAQLIGPIHHGLIHQNAEAQEQFLAEDKSPATLICSPFIGLCTMATIKELNEQLRRELNDKGVKDIPSTLLQLPISDKLEALAPEHFIDVLDKCHAIERIPGQATVTMKERLSDTKGEGDEDHPSNQP